MVALRHALHRLTEPALQEEQTRAVILAALPRRGLLRIQAPLLGTDLIADLGAAGKHRIALRADIDALPISEGTGLPYRSVHAGFMHACGHDGPGDAGGRRAHTLPSLLGGASAGRALHLATGRRSARLPVESWCVSVRVKGWKCRFTQCMPGPGCLPAPWRGAGAILPPRPFSPSVWWESAAMAHNRNAEKPDSHRGAVGEPPRGGTPAPARTRRRRDLGVHVFRRHRRQCHPG